MKASWEVEVIGWDELQRERDLPREFRSATRTWLAEVVGLSARWGVEREFLRPHTDASGANSRGSRGVMYSWVLEPDKLYEAQWRPSWKRVERAYLMVAETKDDQGQVTGASVAQISEKEAKAWLAQRLGVSSVSTS